MQTLNLKDAVNLYERTLILATLIACDWSQRKASQTLGVLPTTLSEKIRRFDLRPPGTPKAAAAKRAARPALEFVPAIRIGAGLNVDVRGKDGIGHSRRRPSGHTEGTASNVGSTSRGVRPGFA